MTDWMAARLIRLGWVETFELERMPNFAANLKDEYKAVAWDKGATKHAPWQSGMTGIGYNTATLAAAGRSEPKSLADLWALPADKITFLSEARDMFGLAQPGAPGVAALMQEIVDWRIAELLGEGRDLVCNVQQNGGGNPILFLPSGAAAASFPRGDLDATIDGGGSRVCVFAINAGAGGVNPQLGCRTL